MEQDFIYILETSSGNGWRELFHDKDLSKLSLIAESISIHSSDSYRIIKLDFQTIQIYGNS